MKIINKQIQLETGQGIDLLDITASVNDFLQASDVVNGLLTVTSHHTTTALFINEYEERLLTDIREYFQNLVPPDRHYLHNDIHLRDCPQDEPENAHSHLIAMMLSSSESVPVIDGKLQLGKWQSLILAELDGPRARTVSLQVLGGSD